MRVAVASIVRLAEELAQARLRNDPFIASYMGVGGYDDAVPDLSPAARQRWRDRLVDVLVGCEQLEADAGDVDSRVLLAAARDDAMRALALVDSRVQEFGVTTFPWDGPSIMLLVAARASVTDAASAAAYLTRCRRLPTYLDQYAARLRTAAASGLLPVAPLVQSVIGQLRDHLAYPDRDPLLGHQPPAGWQGRRRGSRSWSGSHATRSAQHWGATWTCWSSCCPGRGRRSERGCCMCPAARPHTPAVSATARRWRWTPRSSTTSA